MKPITIGARDPVLRAPVDRVAARVTAPGYQYVPAKRFTSDESELPPPMRPISRQERLASGFLDLTGVRKNRLTVIGRYDGSSSAIWVCRCDCGRYCRRTSKALKNERNVADACGECLHLAFLKREHHFKTYGFDKPAKTKDTE